MQTKVLIGPVALITLPYLAVVIYAALRVSEGRELPTWLFVGMFFYFVFGIVGVGIWRQMSVKSTSDQEVPRPAGNTLWIKIGLVFYAVAFINGVRLTMVGTVPIKYGAIGLGVDIFLFALFLWLLLRRANK